MNHTSFKRESAVQTGFTVTKQTIAKKQHTLGSLLRRQHNRRRVHSAVRRHWITAAALPRVSGARQHTGASILCLLLLLLLVQVLLLQLLLLRRVRADKGGGFGREGRRGLGGRGRCGRRVILALSSKGSV